jgi:uncharacterized protein YkwD
MLAGRVTTGRGTRYGLMSNRAQVERGGPVHARSDNRALLPRPDGSELRPARRRITRFSITGIAGATLLLGQCAPQQCAPAPAPATAAPSAALQQVVDLTNQERAANGLPALSVDGRLSAAAQVQSNDQAARDQMSHDGSDGSNAGDRVSAQGYSWSAWAENVAMGYPDAPSVMSGWMGSDGHRRNVLSVNVTQIGVGLAYAADGTPYWTQVFARPR